MTQEINEPHLAAWRNFITLHAKLIDTIDRELIAAERLPLHWYDVLIELAEAQDRRLRMHELADKVVLSRSGLTRLVDRLESAGLLTRQTDPVDRRGAFAVLTDKGREALRQSWPIYASGIQTHFAAHLNDGEAKTLAEIFARLLRVLQEP
jgi:DNA-binding MarR family transcriptional regulator